MANYFPPPQILLDGPRNTVLKLVGALDTSDLPAQTFLIPTNFAGLDSSGTVKPFTFYLTKIQFSIEDGLAVKLLWEDSVSLPIVDLTGRGTEKYEEFGGLKNNAVPATGTGKMVISTQGWSGTMSFTIILHLVKQYRKET